MKTLQGQTIFDLAIQFSGSTEAAFDLAMSNSLNLTDDITPGTDITPTDILNKEIAAYYLAKNIQPATLEAQIITG